ncbi:unnamed protein product [Adineta ricciae]|uniref:Transmembrane protein 183 n=1 Tax=Adineta ricciae TaxID=249248 RepID=A0A814CWA9_ADIRI|nr:unnamed protein product [Adineta ricciae]
MFARISKQTRRNDHSTLLRLAVTDFSVYDETRSSKESSLKNLTQLGKALMDEQDWYEKDLDEFDDLQTCNDHSIVERSSIRSKQKQLVIRENGHGGKIYPLDFWYLIGNYIAPEDVGRFALICQATNQVAHSVPFWINLFRNYNRSQAKRTSRSIVREHVSIVRSYVIKSLYQAYPLFQSRLNKSDVIQKDPHILLSARCIRIWYSKMETQRDLYNYYFEFCFDQTQSSSQVIPSVQALSPLFQIDNQFMIDQNSSLLHVISSKLLTIGPFMGMILSKIVLNVSTDYRYHQLKMWFDTSKLSVQKTTLSPPMVVIDPVICLRIYKWFDCPPKLH